MGAVRPGTPDGRRAAASQRRVGVAGRKTSDMDALSFAARLSIGGILIVSAIPKLLAPLQFQQIVLRYGVLPPPWARPFSRALPFLEAGLGVLLLTGTLTVTAGWVSAGLFLAFVLVVLVARRKLDHGECGCLGRLYRPPATWLLVQDFVLAGLAAFVAFEPASDFSLYGHLSHPNMTDARLALVLALLAAAASTAVGFMGRWQPPARRRGGKVSKEGSAV